jgi:hypothetical protein
MAAYRDAYNELEGTIYGCEVSHISRASNEEADCLMNIGSQCFPVSSGVFWEEINERSIRAKKPVNLSEPQAPKKNKEKSDSGAAPSSDISPEPEEEDEEPEDVFMIEIHWMQPYLAFLSNKELPENVVEGR